MASPSPILQALSRYPGLDRNAVLAVARQEGLSGGIGDGGHAFGPFQENDAGGVLTGRLNGLSPQQKNAWAWSPQGINDALSRINKVAAGQHGAQAVNSIVRGFERPADPNGEVARALGGSQAGGGAPLSAGPAAAPGIPNRQAFVSALLGAISSTGQLENPSALVQALQTRQAGGISTTLGSGGGAAGRNLGSPSGGRGLAELLLEGTGGPTHSTGPHVHAAFTDPQAELAAIKEAAALGLHVGENPYVGDTVDPVHAKNSYHYRDFPGTYNGRKLGEAIDVSGPNQNAFYKWLSGR